MEWRDIESAPEDMRILATDGTVVQESYFSSADGEWRSVSPQSLLWSPPTHWMPLPAPPVAAGQH
jgi:hypothetical protein